MAYRISDDTIEKITESNDIVDVISEYIEVKRTGANYKALCPFHNEKTPSFVISQEKQIYNCFGCGEGGDVIRFVMKYENIDFVEAVKILAERANIELDEKNFKKDSKERDKKEIYYKINREAALYFYNTLKNNSKAYNYLKSRGIDGKIVNTFGLGYSNEKWGDLLNHLKGKGYKIEDIEKVGLIIERKDKNGYYDRFRDRIMFPIIDTKNRVIGFGGRVIGNEQQPKYLNSPETPVFSKGHNLYALNTAKKNSRGKRLLLVEGYMDVISLYSQGVDYCVASLGTALTENQVKLLKRYSDKLYICYDSDNAGQNATNKAIDIFKKNGIDSNVVLLPEGKDPDEYIKKHNKESFEKLLEGSLSFIEYKIYSYQKEYNINSVEGKINFTKRISSVLKQINSPIEIDAYINKISQKTGIASHAIKKEMYGKNNKMMNTTTIKDKYRNGNYRNNNRDNITPVEYKLDQGHLLAEKSLLKLIINDNKIYNKIKDHFKPDEFENVTYRRIANILYEDYQRSQKENLQNIKDILDNNELDELNKVLEFELLIDIKEKDKAVEDYIKNINYYKLEMNRKKIKEDIRKIEAKEEQNEGDVEKFKELCIKLIKIDKELKIHQ